MKHILLSLSIIVMMLCGCSQTSNIVKTENVQGAVAPDKLNFIDEVQQKFVPDRRVNVFDITTKNVDDKIILKGVTTIAEAKTELLNRAQAANLNFIDSIVVLPEKSLGEEIYGVVTLSVGSVRASGQFQAEMVTQALLGTPVRILQGGGWLRVQTPDGYIGYATSGGIKKMNKQQFNEWIAAPKIIFIQQYGFAYATTDATDVISDLVVGNILKLDDETEQYYKVSYPDGRTAYVDKTQAQKLDDWYNSINLTGENIVAYGKRFMGVPYLWGGASAKSLDCSGFAKTVYYMHGIILQRDASQQYYTGLFVEAGENFENLQVGDLVFFGSRGENGKRDRIGHVGIYIGNKQFIHEATQVKINSFDPAAPNYDQYNANRFVRASRIIGHTDTKGISTIKNNEFYQQQK